MNKFNIFTTSFFFCTLLSFDWAQALAPTYCTAKIGASINAVNSTVKDIFGGDTGVFVREKFVAQRFKAFSHCLNIPKVPNRQDLEYIFGLNKYTGEVNQAPYAYFGVQVDSKHYEIGVYYQTNIFLFQKPKQKNGRDLYIYKNPGFSFFTRGVTPYTKYYRDLTFYPGDRVCMMLTYDAAKKQVTFKVFEKESLLEGKPLTKTFIMNHSTKNLPGKFVQFKRVAGLATRATQFDPKPGSNGAISNARVQRLIDQKIYYHMYWDKATFYGLNGQSRPLQAADYYYDTGKNKKCVETTVWPTSVINVIQSPQRMELEFVPQNRTFYANRPSAPVAPSKPPSPQGLAKPTAPKAPAAPVTSTPKKLVSPPGPLVPLAQPISIPATAPKSGFNKK